jgi:multiple sugar transport system substrate-binding protein
MPGPATRTGRNLAGGWSVVIPKGAKNVEGGWQFLKNFTSEPYQYLYYRDNPKTLVSTEIPTRVKVAKDPTVAYAAHPKAKGFLDSLETQYIRPPIPEAQLMFEEMGKASDLIVHLKVEPKAALDSVAAKVNDAMTKWKCA